PHWFELRCWGYSRAGPGAFSPAGSAGRASSVGAATGAALKRPAPRWRAAGGIAFAGSVTVGDVGAAEGGGAASEGAAVPLVGGGVSGLGVGGGGGATLGSGIGGMGVGP